MFVCEREIQCRNGNLFTSINKYGHFASSSLESWELFGISFVLLGRKKEWKKYLKPRRIQKDSRRRKKNKWSIFQEEEEIKQKKMVRAPCCEKMGLKKGPWIPEEDQILISFIQTNGHGNWRALPKQAGNFLNKSTHNIFQFLFLVQKIISNLDGDGSRF